MTHSWHITKHAARRIMEMCIPPQVIRECLEHPDWTYDQRPYAGKDANLQGEARALICHRGFALAVNPERHIVITVLWIGRDQSVREDQTAIWKEGGWSDY